MQVCCGVAYSAMSDHLAPGISKYILQREESALG